MISTNLRDLFSSPVIFVNSKRLKWPCAQKGQREGNYDSDRFQTRTLRYSLRRVSPLDSVNWGSHNPKVGGSNPPPATKQLLATQRLGSRDLLSRFLGQVKANLGKESPKLLRHLPVVIPNHVRVAHGCAWVGVP